MTAARVLAGERAYHLHRGDALELLRGLPDDSVHALVTDPPAGIGFMGRQWDQPDGVAGETLAGRSEPTGRGWDVPTPTGSKVDRTREREAFVAGLTPIFAEALRVMKPGAHGLVWALPRTSHWTALALEDAGFDVRDSIHHLFGQGFPKSLNVSKAIDKRAGVMREPLATEPSAARAWDGCGTALAPGHEVWWLVRKPLGDTVVGCVLEHGTGALSLGDVRVGAEGRWNGSAGDWVNGGGMMSGMDSEQSDRPPVGRWPKNFL